MKMDIKEIQEQCESLSDEQLVLVVNNNILYTADIVKVASQEIRKRNLSRKQIKEIEKKHALESKIITGDIYEDILLLEKIAFFFIFLPRIHFLVLRDYRKKNYVLKLRQAGYFNFSGFITLVSVALLSQLHFSFLACVAIWVLSFVPAYLFNEYYFKQRTIRRLEARTSNTEIERPDQRFYP